MRVLFDLHIIAVGIDGIHHALLRLAEESDFAIVLCKAQRRLPDVGAFCQRQRVVQKAARIGSLDLYWRRFRFRLVLFRRRVFLFHAFQQLLKLLVFLQIALGDLQALCKDVGTESGPFEANRKPQRSHEHDGPNP